MNRSYKFLSTAALCILLLAGCKKQAYYLQNPNNPSEVTPGLLLPDILVNIFKVSPHESSFADRHLTYYERPSTSINYGWNRADYNSYDILRQAKDMDAKAQLTGEVNYQGLAKFFRAVCFIKLTETFGDVPYSDAMKALDGLVTPKYDAQKEVYKGVLSELEEANAMLDPSKGNLEGDIIFGNGADEILQWKKVVNAFRLRVLIHLSKKAGDGDLNIKQQFQAITGDPSKYPLMSSNDDNAQLVFNTTADDNAYPTYKSLSSQTSISMEKGFVAILKERKDPRLFSFAEPISGEPENDFDSYDGVDAGLSVSDQQSTSANASRIKKRYWNNPVNEPLIFLGYAEQELLIAEAISRGWITGNAEAYYKAGITASMNFYGISGNDVSTYLEQANVKFNSAKAIEMIIIQKYISFFMNSGWEAFFEQRRTGIPTLSVGPGTLNGGKVPKRWLYPQAEFTNNADNVNAAVQSQYGGNDDINAEMWLIK